MPTLPRLPRRRRKDEELATLRAELAAVSLRPARCTVHRAPCIPCTLHTVHRAPCTVHRAPCTVHRTLSFLHCTTVGCSP